MQLPASEAVAAGDTSDFSVFEDTVLTKYTGKSSTVVVPDGIQTIATDAFKNNAYVTSVVIPKSVTRIEPYAFWGCSVSKVTLGAGLTEIGDYAFANCKKLSSIDIPENIERIGLYAFEDNISLTDAYITYKTMNIHETAFDGCYKLIIHAPEGSYPYKYAQDFYKRQIDFNEYEDVSNFSPDGNSSGNGTSGGNGDDTSGNGGSGNGNNEGNGAGNSDGLGNGSSVHFIYNPDGTVSSMTDYSSIINGNSDTYGSSHVVGNQAVVFMDSASPNVYMGSNPPSYNGSGDNAGSGTGMGTGIGDGSMDDALIAKYTIVDGETVADQAYYCNTKINYVALPDTIKEIGQFAYARSTVSSIVLPERLERIAYGAFYHCDRLDSVTIPESVMFVEPNAFTYTSWVENFMAEASGEQSKAGSPEDFLISGGVLIAYRGNAETVVIPDGTRSIAAKVFEGHNEIRKVVLPKSLMVVGEEAFYGCSALDEINLDNSSVKYILDRAFKDTSIEKMVLPSALAELGINAFDSDAVLFYLGSAPITTHESSAERLSNGDLREMAKESALVPEDETEAETELKDYPIGVTVTIGEEKSADTDIVAYLEAADEAYVLNITELASSAEIEKAMERVHDIISSRSFINPSVYEMILTDGSNIPITKLGKAGLTIAMPVPGNINGNVKMTVLTIDRNGQLEEIPTETVSVNGRKYVRFTTYHLSPFAIYSTGNLLKDGELITADEAITALAVGPDGMISETVPQTGSNFIRWVKVKKWRLLGATACLGIGFTLLAYKKKKA